MDYPATWSEEQKKQHKIKRIQVGIGLGILASGVTVALVRARGAQKAKLLELQVEIENLRKELTKTHLKNIGDNLYDYMGLKKGYNGGASLEIGGDSLEMVKEYFTTTVGNEISSLSKQLKEKAITYDKAVEKYREISNEIDEKIKVLNWHVNVAI